MKLTFLLIFVAMLQVSANVNGQGRVSLNVKQVEISKVLHSIEKQGVYRFLYNSRLNGIGNKINVEASNEPIGEVLSKMFAGTDLSYKLLDNNLIVVLSRTLAVQDITVTGKVTGDNGIGLSGVSVSVKGSSRGTTTDNNGNFTLTVPEKGILVISYIGFQTQEVPINSQSVIDVKLVPSTKIMDQVVVVGYGTQRKIDVTGAVATIKGEEISKQASTNPISGLQGKVAGVQIINNGQPGSSPQITIRGTGTIYGSTSPLYVVDGVWFDDIGFLNPNDIESINILKDASSESIYGIRAANGVVLIVTKKGKNGKPIVNYNGYIGYQRATNQLKMANGTEYATLLNEKSIITGGDSLFTNPSQFGAGTNWYNQLLQNAFTTNHQASVSGGSEKSTYNFSVGYLDQQGIIKTNDYKRYTVRLQNDYQVSRFIKVGYSALGTSSYSTDVYGGLFNQLFNAAPIVPVRYKDGAYGDPADYALGPTVANPQATQDFYIQNSKNNYLTGNLYADIKFAKHFTFHSSIGGEYVEQEVKNYLPVYYATSIQNNTISLLTVERIETRNWILENTLTYENRIGDHHITVLAGQTAQENDFNHIKGTAKNVPNTSTGDWFLGLGDNSNVTDVDATGHAYPLKSTVASYFGRLNYSFKDRYLLTASVRGDGSSKFTGNQRWGYFPSIGAGWVISQEGFMQNQHIFNTLKLRGSWGKIGNASIPPNLSTLQVAQGGSLIAFYGNPSNPYTGASVNSLIPPTLYWEKGVGTDIGLEAALLKNKLSIDADYYIKKTQRAIFDAPILASLGTTSNAIIQNQADFQNQGVEVALTWKDNINKDWSYSVSGNIGINTNKVLSVVTGSNPIYGGAGGATSGQYTTRTVAGQPIGQFFGQKVIGIFQSQADINSYVNKGGTPIMPNARPGDFKFQDTNGDGVIDAKDRVILGNPNPKYSYGLNTNWNYKEFDLTLDFQGVAGVQLYQAQQGLRYGSENYTKDFYDHRWHGAGTSNTNPSADIVGGNNYLPNSWFVQSGSYFRIRNMQLGYTLPKALMDRLKLTRLRIYVNAQNAFNFFKYKGFSPEIGRVAGANPTNTGIDTNVYPLSATYNFGLNLTL
ncbi:MAG TPA: SusC/RagA family TonB-linked outer membrane protein [Puia sp.]|nr:SusC/RagA family TonB-linked outer membrane protein [Puia sp.]